jgi:hypothetical protein
MSKHPLAIIVMVGGIAKKFIHSINHLKALSNAAAIEAVVKMVRVRVVVVVVVPTAAVALVAALAVVPVASSLLVELYIKVIAGLECKRIELYSK